MRPTPVGGCHAVFRRAMAGGTQIPTGPPPALFLDQTETGFRSFEPAALQKVVVSVVVWPFLVAVSSIGRHVLPSARVVGAATGLAATTVAGAVEAELCGTL